MKTALEFDGVVKTYGRRCRALDGLHLAVPAGSLFGLVGSNGAGKTTAMAAACGLLRLTAGRIDLLGDGPFHPARHAGRIALLPQDSRLPPHSLVEDLLRYYGRLQGLCGAELETSVDDVIDWVHLQDRRRAAVRTLSHGMMRRVTIAQAFLGRPELVFLDEPMSGLDPRESARIRALLHRRRGAQTIVISSHNLHELETLCDMAAFVEAGRLVRQDGMAQLTRRAGRLTYHLKPGPIPVEEVRLRLPRADCRADPAAGLLDVRFQQEYETAEAVNAAVLPVLLAAGVAILDVRRGSNLESEYLAGFGQE